MNVKITMIGTGYVGLVTGACFAELGHDVICVDKNQAKVDGLLAGQMPIYEPGLEDLVHRNVVAGRLRFSTDTASSVQDRDAVFIAVGTPSVKGSDQADLTYVEAAAAEVAANVNQLTIMVTKSTVPVGTNKRLAEHVRRHLKPTAGLSIVSNPEFLREGAAISDFMEPDRIVIGADDPAGIAVMKRIYAPLMAQDVPLLVTGVETAEVIKYAANAFLAIKVSFINEVSDLCERLGAEVTDVSRGIGLDKRIGGAFLNPGPGWGGSCFPKDTRALQATAVASGMNLAVVEAAIAANGQRKHVMMKRITDRLGDDLRGRRIAAFGVTFKGQTDDMRDSPAVEVINALAEAGAAISCFDPSNPHEAGILLPGLPLSPTPEAAAKDADLLIVLTDWKVFRTYDFAVIAAQMRTPAMLDLRNLLDGDSVLAAGFTHYERLGRSLMRPSADGVGKKDAA